MHLYSVALLIDLRGLFNGCDPAPSINLGLKGASLNLPERRFVSMLRPSLLNRIILGHADSAITDAPYTQFVGDTQLSVTYRTAYLLMYDIEHA